MEEKKGFWKGFGGILRAFVLGIVAFFKDSHTDSQDKWDFKLVLGTVFLGFSLYYIGWMHLGDVAGFLAIAGIGAGLHGWAASPWGGSSPVPQSPIVGLPSPMPWPGAVINQNSPSMPIKEGP